MLHVDSKNHRGEMLMSRFIWKILIFKYRMYSVMLSVIAPYTCYKVVDTLLS